MKFYIPVLIIFLVIGIVIGLNLKPIEAQISAGITSINIQTSNGTLQTTGNLKFFGINGMTVKNNASGLIISNNIVPGNGIKITNPTNSSALTIAENRIVTTGSLEQINWNPQNQNNYLSVQMELNSQYPLLVKNTQPFQGTITNVSITPIINTMSSSLTLTLYDNGVSTKKSITIPSRSNAGIITTINQDFNQGDSLTWVITSQTKEPNSLIFNAQVMISYIG